MIGDRQTAIVFMSVVFDAAPTFPTDFFIASPRLMLQKKARSFRRITPSYMCSGLRWKGQTGSQVTVPATIRTIIIGARLSFLMGTRWTPALRHRLGRGQERQDISVIRRTLTPTTPTANHRCWRWPTAGSWRQEMAFPETSRGMATPSTRPYPLRWTQWRGTQSRST